MSRILRRRAVLEKTGLSKSTMYEQIEAGLFPKPVQLSLRTVGWLEDEINEWIGSRKPTSPQSIEKQK